MLRTNHLIAILIAVLLLVAASACTSNEAQIKELDSQRQSSQQRLDAIGKNVSSLRGQSNELTNELRANRNQTLAFVRDHPGIVACIASGAIGLDEGNVFSDDIQEFGATVGLICAVVYIASEDFQKSVDDFISEIDAASDREKNLESRLAAVKSKIESEARAWEDEKVKFDALTEKINKLRAEDGG
jgi:predicted  nucleic acid-binding Zn-ribbon protein